MEVMKQDDGVPHGMDEQRLNEARNILIEQIEAHRRVRQNPGRCLEAANTLAWIAHSIGASRNDVTRFPALLARYDIHCGCEACQAKRAAAAASPPVAPRP